MVKPKPVPGKYTGPIEPDQSYLCKSDSNILKVESITRPKEVWMVNLRYEYSLTKKNQSVSIVSFDFERDIESGKFERI